MDETDGAGLLLGRGWPQFPECVSGMISARTALRERTLLSYQGT